MLALQQMLKETRAKLSRNLALRLFFYPEVNNNRQSYFPSVSTWLPTLSAPRQIPLSMFEEHVDVMEKKILHDHLERLKKKGDDASLIKNIRELKSKEKITVAKADKNMGVCVIATKEFLDFGMEHISDKSMYHELPPLVFETKLKNQWNRLRLILQEHKLLVDDNGRETALAKSLLHLENAPPKAADLQLLFKVHKQPLKIRPIASNFSTISTNTSIYVHRCLIKYLKMIPTIATSSRAVIQKLRDLQFSDANLQLATIDIINFYPSITHVEGLRRTKDLLKHLAMQQRNDLLLQQQEHLLELLKWVLENNYITFNGHVLHQVKGTAMGTNVAVVYANLVAASIEMDVVSRLQSSIKFYVRYIDDIFVIGNNIPTLIKNLNEQSPTIKFELTSKRSDVVEFLDAQFELKNKKISSKIYEKPGNQHSYLLPTSNHSSTVQVNLINTEVRRIRTLCTEDFDFFDAILTFKVHLSRRKYHKNLLRIVDILALTVDKTLAEPKKTVQENKLCVVINDLNNKEKFPLKRLLIVPSNITDITINGEHEELPSKYGRFLSEILNDSIVGKKRGRNIYSMLQRKKRATNNSRLNEPSRKRALEDEQDRGGETANTFARVCAPASPNPNPNPHANPSPNPSLTLANCLGLP
jgi:hypothetical protein